MTTQYADSDEILYQLKDSKMYKSNSVLGLVRPLNTPPLFITPKVLI
jgi:hypothetical protein